MSILTVKDLSVNINANEVNNVSFAINPGQLFALLGESGSGKSLTALAIMRLLPQNALYSKDSIIKLSSTNLLELSERNMRKVRGRKISMIFQDPMTSLNPVLTIGKQINEALSRVSPNANYTSIELLEKVRIPNAIQRLKSYPHELSGGMKQRVMIAMALACKPKLLIADEPTTALDVTTQAEILALLREIISEEQMALLFITHDLALAANNADLIAVMQKGKIVEQTTSKEFFSSAKDPYSLKLLRSLPSNLQIEINKPTEEDILTVQNLKVYFPIYSGIMRRVSDYIKAVDDVSFAVNKGETLALVGESGSGKTTIGKALLDLIPEACGKIAYMGKRQQVVFQDPYASLDPKVRIIDSLAEGISKKPNTMQIIDKLLQQVGLPLDYKWRFPHEFSGGERQRLCIARALSVDPDLIICDEPTSSLDVSVQAQILQLLASLQRDLQLTYIFITHDISLVKLLAHRVVVVYQGKIVEYGDTKTVLNNPTQEYTHRLLHAVPSIK